MKKYVCKFTEDETPVEDVVAVSPDEAALIFCERWDWDTDIESEEEPRLLNVIVADLHAGLVTKHVVQAIVAWKYEVYAGEEHLSDEDASSLKRFLSAK